MLKSAMSIRVVQLNHKAKNDYHQARRGICQVTILCAACCGDAREAEDGFIGGIFQRERDFH